MESQRCRRDGSQKNTPRAVHHFHPPAIGKLPSWIRPFKDDECRAKTLRSRTHYIYEDGQRQYEPSGVKTNLRIGGEKIRKRISGSADLFQEKQECPRGARSHTAD